MSLERVFGLLLRYFYYLRRSYDRLLDVFYTPLIDLLIWGLTSQYFESLSKDGAFLVQNVVFGLLFWIMVWRSQHEIVINLLQEYWDSNVINLFITPLTIQEWLVAIFINGITKVLISFGFASYLALLLYDVNITNLGLPIFAITIGLLGMGWAIGMFIAGLVFLLGTKAQTISAAVITAISPFSAIFYPMSELPTWAQHIAKIIPASYLFDALRILTVEQLIRWDLVIPALILNVVYLFIAYTFLKWSFTVARQYGLLKHL